MLCLYVVFLLMVGKYMYAFKINIQYQILKRSLWVNWHENIQKLNTNKGLDNADILRAITYWKCGLWNTQKNVLCWNWMCNNTKCQLFYVYVICLVLDSSIDFDNIHRVTIRIIYVLCFLFVFCLLVCFVCLHSVYCVPNGASFSGWPIIYFSFGFLSRLFTFVYAIYITAYPDIIFIKGQNIMVQ